MIQKQLQEAFQHGKRTIGNMFNHAVKWAGQIDQAFNVGKRIYGALQPAIQDMGISGTEETCVDRSEGLARTRLFHPWGREPEGGWSGSGVLCRTSSDTVTC